MFDLSGLELTIFAVVFLSAVGAIALALLVFFTLSLEGEIKEMRRHHERQEPDEHEDFAK